MGVGLEPDPLAGEPEPEEEPRIGLGREERALADEASERPRELGFSRDVAGDGVGGVEVVRGRLDRELTAGSDERGEVGQERLVVRHPVDRGVREDHVEAAAREGGEVAPPEGETAAGLGGRPLQHRRGGVDPDGLPRAEPLVGEPGQLPRSAPQVENPGRLGRLQRREKIEERRGPLGPEYSVPFGVPHVAVAVGQGR